MCSVARVSRHSSKGRPGQVSAGPFASGEVIGSLLSLVNLVAVLQTPVERRVGERLAARVVGVLEFVETPVEVAAREELLVRAALAQLAVVQDEYLVGALDGRETVRADDGDR